MGNQSFASVETLPGPSSGEAHQPIGHHVEANSSWPEPTSPEKSGTATVSAPEDRGVVKSKQIGDCSGMSKSGSHPLPSKVPLDFHKRMYVPLHP